MLKVRVPWRRTKAERIRSIQEAWRKTPPRLRHLFRLALFNDCVPFMRREVGAWEFRRLMQQESCPHCIVCLARRKGGKDVSDELPVMHCGALDCGRILKSMKRAERSFYDSRRVAYLESAKEGMVAA